MKELEKLEKMENIHNIIDRLAQDHNASDTELLYILTHQEKDINEYLFKKAEETRNAIYGNKIYIRGLIEISNYCHNNCFYCGIRKDNNRLIRYRTTKEEILECCNKGYELGFRTFVLQGGEDDHYTDEIMSDIIRSIKKIYNDCAITLSLGERSFSSYEKLFKAGADRYLLRHESIDPKHYQMLHPKEQQISSRIKCLEDLKKIGYQVGCGIMVGSPFQTLENIVEDLRFMKKFGPQMVGIGPFITQKDTPFFNEKSGSQEMTLVVLSIVRLLLPNVLLPATTALATIGENGRILGIKAGCNVIMPNLSPKIARDNYKLYDNKKTDGDEAGENLSNLKKEMLKIGYQVVVDRGDPIIGEGNEHIK